MDNWHFPIDPVQIIYGLVAVCGGVARYLSTYASGAPFNAAYLAASAFVSGFSGYMFALLGVSMNLPEPMLFMLAGVGGFFGDQTMKLILEVVSKKVS